MLVHQEIFLFNDTATTEIYTLSLHDALPISLGGKGATFIAIGITISTLGFLSQGMLTAEAEGREDRKSTRLNSSHMSISYAVFCLKKKKNARTSTCPR